jgi:antirestriction protein
MKKDAKIFLTDYASYNEGTQFEFGHWVDLDNFSDADELRDYITNHFAEADKKRPLLCGTPREEIMITDFEGFPRALYSETMDFDKLFEFYDRAESCHYDNEVIEAFADLGNYDINDVDTFFDTLEESYQGKHESDEAFAQEIAEELGFIDNNVSWPYTCIDWEYAARELMYDYYESNGHYFRAL